MRFFSADIKKYSNVYFDISRRIVCLGIIQLIRFLFISSLQEVLRYNDLEGNCPETEDLIYIV